MSDETLGAYIGDLQGGGGMLCGVLLPFCPCRHYFVALVFDINSPSPLTQVAAWIAKECCGLGWASEDLREEEKEEEVLIPEFGARTRIKKGGTRQNLDRCWIVSFSGSTTRTSSATRS